MSLLPAPVNQALRKKHSILDGTSPSTISPLNQDGYHTRPSPSPLNTDDQDVSSNSVDQVNDTNKKTRKFVCQYCGRKFLRAEHLRRHEITRNLTLFGFANFSQIPEINHLIVHIAKRRSHEGP